jgi:hypothetical protein
LEDIIKEGMSKCLKISLGITTAATNFMSMINKALIPFINSFMVLYLNDILNHCKTWEEHVNKLKQGLDTIKDSKF